MFYLSKKRFDLKKYLKQKKTYEAVTVEFDEDNEPQIVFAEVTQDEEKEEHHKLLEYHSTLRHRIVEVPDAIYKAPGIRIFGRRIKSFLFTTDLALIRNSNADAVMAVYPFTPEGIIIDSIVKVSSVPIVAGVGGGTTTGKRSVRVAFDAEQSGVFGVVVNAPMKNEVIKEIDLRIDVPIIATVTSDKDDYIGKLNAGADFLNVSGAGKTAEIVRQIRKEIGSTVPIIATGGPSDDSVIKTIEAGANAITYTPPTSAEIFAEVMEQYRKVNLNDI